MIGLIVLLLIVILLLFFWLLPLAAHSPDEPDLEEDYLPDSLNKGRINPALADVEEATCSYAGEHNVARWGLRAVMGGPGSIRQWHPRKSSAKDFLHHNPKARILHGQPLYQASIRGYIEFSEN